MILAICDEIPPNVSPKRFNQAMRPILSLVTACIVALSLAACGGDSKVDTPTSVGGDDSGSLGPPTVLTFTYKDGKKDRETARLTCTGERGSSGTGYLAKSADDACKQIDSAGKLLIDGPDETVACTQVYGGPETVKVSGRVDFETVDREFGRTNGCEIADWEKLQALLPPNAPG